MYAPDALGLLSALLLPRPFADLGMNPRHHALRVEDGHLPGIRRLPENDAPVVHRFQRADKIGGFAKLHARRHDLSDPRLKSVPCPGITHAAAHVLRVHLASLSINFSWPTR